MDTTKTKNVFDALYEFEKNHDGFPKGAINGMLCLLIKIRTMSNCEIKVGDFIRIKSKCEIEVGDFISIDGKSVCTTFKKGDKYIIVSVNSRFINIDERNYIGGAKCIKKVGRTHTDSAARFICEYLNK